MNDDDLVRPEALPTWRQRTALRLLNAIGWQFHFKPLPGPHGIAVVYPHTSNWDFPVGLLAKWAVGLHFRWLAKDTLFRGPMGPLMRYWGGVAVDRSAPQGAILRLAQTMRASDWFWLANTPEGTRSYRPHWKSGFYRIADHVGFTLRRLLFGRLMAMLFEGVFTWFMLTLGGVPMAGLLGLVTGVLAFIPNIGAITSGVLMIAVGFSASANQGVWCIVVYFLVHNIDAYVVMPYVARRTVDLAPAVVLAFQLLMAALFGILGVLFADPILATLKVILVDISKQQAVEDGDEPAVVDPARSTVGAPAPAAPAPAVAAAASAGPASAASGPRRRGRSSGPGPRS